MGCIQQCPTTQQAAVEILLRRFSTMDQKRKLSVFSKLIFLLMSFTLVLLMGIKADARPKEWTELEGQWYCADGNVYYIIGNTFYVSPMEPHSMGERHKIAGWKTVDGEYLKIVHGYGNKVFINKIDELDGSSILYAVDIKTKNKAKISGKCSITAASGRYMYGNAEKASDTGAYPVFIWKISGNSVKKGKTLGKFIFGTNIFNIGNSFSCNCPRNCIHLFLGTRIIRSCH